MTLKPMACDVRARSLALSWIIRLNESITDWRWVLVCVASLNISDMRTGKCIAKLFPNGASQVDGFERTSAIAFCSDYNELYTGNKHGQVTFWSNA